MTTATIALSAEFAGAGIVDLTEFGASETPSVTVTRGTDSLVTYGFTAGNGSFDSVLDNWGRTFDPNFAAGPYFGDLIPGVPMFAVADWDSNQYQLITGTADGWPQEYPLNGAHQTLPLHASDDIAFLSGAQAAVVAPKERSGARINRILDAVGYIGSRDIAPGNCIISALPFGTVSALSHITDVVNAEWGSFFFTPNGTATFHSRDTLASLARVTTSQATFVQSGGLNFNDATMVSPPVVNDYTLTYSDKGDQVNAQNGTSIASPLRVRSQNQSLPIATKTQAQQYANWVVARYAFPVTTFGSITLQPSNEPGATFDLWEQVLTRELGDLITVTLDPLNANGGLSGAPITRDCWIRGITHNWQAGVWTTRFSLQDASWIATLAHFDVSDFDGPDIFGF